MKELKIPPFHSGGLILSYRCSNAGRHCVYASSPFWKDWMSEEDVKHFLAQIKKHAPGQVGLHVGGGEPFLNYKLTLRTVELCIESGVPIQYVETNAFWCKNDKVTAFRFQELRDSGLPAILISASPFHAEFIPFDRTERAIRIAREIYGLYNVLVYTDYFYQQLKGFDLNSPLPFSEYLQKIGREEAANAFINYYGLIPCGRTATKLNFLFVKQNPEEFKTVNCLTEMTNPEHIHIDNYGNYIPSFCAGISLGDADDLGRLYEGINLEEKPILEILIQAGPWGLLNLAIDQFDYPVREDGYMTKCHLCQDVRSHIVQMTDQFSELKPVGFYQNL